jgi:hypothetical protein
MHVNQKPRRRHSEQFKAQVLAACAEPGASVSAVALSFGLNDQDHSFMPGVPLIALFRLAGPLLASTIAEMRPGQSVR